MYQSLYRTWRPRTFSDMIGQDAIIRTLKNQTKAGHIAHAYLFCGSRGTGKTSAARIMATAINCLNPLQGDPCLQCDSCRAILNESSLDIFEMDAASNSRVEETREMLEKVNYPPQFSKYKVYIIDEVHMLSNAAFNALLKTLEEPPYYMVFILATTEPQKIPPTILSRCQRFDFGRISEEYIVERLKIALGDGQQAEKDALELIASAAEGSMRDAWSIMDMCLEANVDLSQQRVRDVLGTVSSEFLFRFLDALGKQDAALCMSLVEQLMQDGRDVQVFFRELARHIRRVIEHGLKKAATDSSEPSEHMMQQYHQFGLSALADILERCLRAEADTRWASSPRTVLEVFSLRLCEEISGFSVQSLMKRLSLLEEEINQLKANGFSPSGQAPVKETVAPTERAAKTIDEPSTSPFIQAPAKVVTKASKPAEDDGPTKQVLPKDAWNNALIRIKSELTSCYGIIQQGRFCGYKDGCFRLSYDKEHSFFINFMNDEARKKTIEQILSQEFGSPSQFLACPEEDKTTVLDREEQAAQDIDLLSSIVGRENLIVQEKKPGT